MDELPAAESERTKLRRAVVAAIKRQQRGAGAAEWTEAERVAARAAVAATIPKPWGVEWAGRFYQLTLPVDVLRAAFAAL